MHANEINNSMFAATFLGSVVCPSKYNDNNDDYYDDYDHNYCFAILHAISIIDRIAF